MTTKYKVVLDNVASACGTFSETFDTFEAADTFGHNWAFESNVRDFGTDDPEGVEPYSYDVVTVDVPSDDEKDAHEGVDHDRARKENRREEHFPATAHSKMHAFVLRGGPTLDGGAFPGRAGGVLPNVHHMHIGQPGQEVSYRRTNEIDERGRVVFEFEATPYGTATYSPEDNKLRVTPRDPNSRLDAETYKRVRAAGFAWAPRQRIFVAPMWTPEREDVALELCGEIGDEDTSLVERAEERAERFEAYGDRREADAERAHAAVAEIAGNIPAGQPILVGHHSARRARRDAERIEAGLKRAVSLWETSKYWERRAAGAVKAAKYKERPDVRHRRIRGLEADRRRIDKGAEEARLFAKLWAKDGLTREAAMKIANVDRGLAYGLWSALDRGEMTPEEARAIALAAHGQTLARAARWIAHVDNRLTYERAMLAEAGGVITDRLPMFAIEPGGKVLVANWHRVEQWVTVKRVNRTGDAIVSVSVAGNAGGPRVVGIEEIKDYREADPDDVAKVRAASKLSPLVNVPSPGCQEMTQAQWERRRASGSASVQKIKGTAEHGAYRQREGFVPGGSWRSAPIYLTDQKRVDLPGPDAAPAPTFAREVVGREERPTVPIYTPEPSKFDALKASLKAGVTVISADQLFPTPEDLAGRMAEIADVRAGSGVLEPSAGTGVLVRAAQARGANVQAVEVNAKLAEILNRTTSTLCADFLTCRPGHTGLGSFDAVLMNPPFADGADCDHVRHACAFLKPGGTLVAVMGASTKTRENYATVAFRAFLAEHGGTIEDLPDGTFEASGTGVRTVLVVVRAP